MADDRNIIIVSISNSISQILVLARMMCENYYRIRIILIQLSLFLSISPNTKLERYSKSRTTVDGK